MAINVRGGRQNLVYAKVTTPLDGSALNSSNTNIVYEFGDIVSSWEPGREFNPLTTLTKHAAYMIHPKVDMDLESLFMPPFNFIALEDGNEILPE